MDISQLEAIGLSQREAAAYVYILENGDVSPAIAAKELDVSRTNAYKLFDKLVEYGIVDKNDHDKKITYSINNPMSLNDYVYSFRAEATSREEAVNSVMKDLLQKYNKHSPPAAVTTLNGKEGVLRAFKQQLSLKEDLYFIHSRTDVAAMGWDTMHAIRTDPARHGLQRHGIMNKPSRDTPVNYATHERSNLAISWIDKDSYTMPVEWSVTESSLLIVVYSDNMHAVLIQDELIATSFLQIWHMVKNYAGSNSHK